MSSTVTNPGLVSALLAARPLTATAFASVRLLIPGQDLGGGRVALRVGASMDHHRVVWAFSDEEALQAWARAPVAEAGVVYTNTLVEMLADDSAVLALNPAGPGARVLTSATAQVVLTPTPPAPRLLEPARDGPLVEIEGRQHYRRRIRASALRGATAQAAGRHTEALVELGHALDACRELGDRVHGAAVLAQQVASLVALDRAAEARAAAERAGLVLAELGELEAGFECLLDAAELAWAAEDRSDANRLARQLINSLSPSSGDRLARLWERLSAPAFAGGAAR